MPTSPDAPTSSNSPPSPDSPARGTDEHHDDEPLDPLPWHFKLLVAAITVYLGFRAFQGIEWLVQQV